MVSSRTTCAKGPAHRIRYKTGYPTHRPAGAPKLVDKLWTITVSLIAQSSS